MKHEPCPETLCVLSTQKWTVRPGRSRCMSVPAHDCLEPLDLGTSIAAGGGGRGQLLAQIPGPSLSPLCARRAAVPRDSSFFSLEALNAISKSKHAL